MLRYQTFSVFIAVSALLLASGCDSKAPEAPARTIDSSPQAKFDRVVAALRKGLDTGVESGGGRYTFSDTDGAGSTVFSYTIDTPEKISEPTAPGRLPRAKIRITQRSSYSALTSSKDDDEEEKKKKDKRDKADQLAPEDKQAELEAMGYEVLDPALVDKNLADATTPNVRTPDFSTRTISTDTAVEYELVFENNQWRMAGPPPADAPESANIAMDLALKRQR